MLPRRPLGRLLLASAVLAAAACSPESETLPDFAAEADDPLHMVAPELVDLAKDDGTTSDEVNAAFEAFEAAFPVGSVLPDFALRSLAGEEVRLSDLRGRAVVLVAGSVSCPLMRGYGETGLLQLRAQMAPVSGRTGHRFESLIVTTKEAHPALDPSPYTTGTQWTTRENLEDGILVRQPTTFVERARLAWGLSQLFGNDPGRVLVDRMDDAVWAQLGGVVNPLFVLDGEGRIVFREAWAFRAKDFDKNEPSAFTAVRTLLEADEAH